MPIVPYPTFPHAVTGKEIQIGIEARGVIKNFRTYQVTTVLIAGGGGKTRRVQLQFPYIKRIQPGSGPQLAQQQKLADAVLAWQVLDPGDKETWREIWRAALMEPERFPAAFQASSGYNLYIQNYLLTH